jgi:hypothetical protein
MALSGDEDVVETFPAQCSDEAFHDRIRPRRPDRGADDPDIGTAASNAAVNLLSRSRIKNRNRSVRSPKSINRLRACWGDPRPVGWAVIPAMCTRRRPRSITTRT